MYVLEISITNYNLCCGFSSLLSNKDPKTAHIFRSESGDIVHPVLWSTRAVESADRKLQIGATKTGIP